MNNEMYEKFKARYDYEMQAVEDFKRKGDNEMAKYLCTKMKGYIDLALALDIIDSKQWDTLYDAIA